MTPHDPHNHTDSDLKEKQSREYTPERPADLLTQHIVSSLKRDYFIIGKRRIRSWHAWLMIGIIAGGTFTLALVANRSGEFEQGSAAITNIQLPNAESQEISIIESESRALQALFKQDHEQKQLSVPGRRALRQSVSSQEIERKMLEGAERRLKSMERLLERNPEAVLAYRILPYEREQYPQAVRNLIESDVNLQGRLEVIHGHDFQNKTSFYEYVLVSGQERLNLHLTSSPPTPLHSGAKVHVEGVRVKNEIIVPIGQDK